MRRAAPHPQSIREARGAVNSQVGALVRLMEAAMMRQVDEFQLWTNQLIFSLRRREQQVIAYSLHAARPHGETDSRSVLRRHGRFPWKHQRFH